MPKEVYMSGELKDMWCYAQDEGCDVEVEIVDLGLEINTKLRNIYLNPTNLTELIF